MFMNLYLPSDGPLNPFPLIDEDPAADNPVQSTAQTSAQAPVCYPLPTPATPTERDAGPLPSSTTPNLKEEALTVLYKVECSTCERKVDAEWKDCPWCGTSLAYGMITIDD